MICSGLNTSTCVLQVENWTCASADGRCIKHCEMYKFWDCDIAKNGRKSWGLILQNLEWGTLMYIVRLSRFLAFKSHNSNSVCVFITSQSTSSTSTNTDQTITSSGRFNIFWQRHGQKIPFRIHKNMPFQLKKKFFFSGEGLDLSQTPPLMARIPLPHPTPVLAKTSEFAHLFPQNSKQFYTTAIKSMF